MANLPRLEFERDIIEVQDQIDGLVAAAERGGFDVSDGRHCIPSGFGWF